VPDDQADPAGPGAATSRSFDVLHTWWFAWFASHPDDARLVE
jgi:hypothetical protein